MAHTESSESAGTGQRPRRRGQCPTPNGRQTPARRQVREKKPQIDKNQQNVKIPWWKRTDRGEVGDSPFTVSVVPAPNTPHSDTGPHKNLLPHGRAVLDPVDGLEISQGMQKNEGDGLEMSRWTQQDEGMGTLVPVEYFSWLGSFSAAPTTSSGDNS